jgi:hypothetical protein
VGLDDGVVPLGDVLEVSEERNTSSIGRLISTVFSKVATSRSLSEDGGSLSAFTGSAGVP